jgi:hypothetical protein
MYWEIFLYLIPVLFLFYLVWDGLKYWESRERFKGLKAPLKGFEITFYFAISTVAIGLIYLAMIQSQVWTRDLTVNRISMDLGLVIVYVVHTGLYRWFKRTPEREGS